MKDFVRFIVIIVIVLLLAILASYCDNHYPPTKTVQGHEYIRIGHGHSSTWVHSENCPCKKK